MTTSLNAHTTLRLNNLSANNHLDFKNLSDQKILATCPKFGWLGEVLSLTKVFLKNACLAGAQMAGLTLGSRLANQWALGATLRATLRGDVTDWAQMSAAFGEKFETEGLVCPFKPALAAYGIVKKAEEQKPIRFSVVAGACAGAALGKGLQALWCGAGKPLSAIAAGANVIAVGTNALALKAVDIVRQNIGGDLDAVQWGSLAGTLSNSLGLTTPLQSVMLAAFAGGTIGTINSADLLSHSRKNLSLCIFPKITLL